LRNLRHLPAFFFVIFLVWLSPANTSFVLNFWEAFEEVAFFWGLLRCNFAPAWSLNRLSPEVSHVCLLVSISATWFSFLWRSWMFWVCNLFETRVCKSSLREIILCLLSLPALLFLFCVFSKENLAPPSRLRFGVLFSPLVELASAFYPDILCCSCVIDFMSRICNDIVSCESVLSAHSELYPCL
jgi:hypothetical protein